MISNLITRKILTLLKVQYSNMLEYRAEIALWAISGILPLLMLAVWIESKGSIQADLSREDLNEAFLSAVVTKSLR